MVFQYSFYTQNHHRTFFLLGKVFLHLLLGGGGGGGGGEFSGKKSGEWTISRKMTRQKEQED